MIDANALHKLFPAYAGVIRIIRSSEDWYSSFPRIRGGDPIAMNKVTGEWDFSPHTRG